MKMKLIKVTETTQDGRTFVWNLYKEHNGEYYCEEYGSSVMLLDFFDDPDSSYFVEVV